MRTLVVCGIALSFILSGCKSGQPIAVDSDDVDLVDTIDVIERAYAIIKPIKDSKVKGVVTFETVQDGVLVTADIDGLTPGKHGFHIHEFGDCGKDGDAAGGHFNPDHTKHGGPDDKERHVGDLGNIVADEKGHAHYERIDQMITLVGKNSVIGRSVVIHEKEDDFKSQPAGNSGARIACGIIAEGEEP